MKSSIIGLAGIAGLAAIIAASYRPGTVMLAVSCVAAAVVGYGWPHYLGVPARKTLGSIIALAGIGAAFAAAFSPVPGVLGWVPAFIALGIGAVFVMQLLRGTGQAQRLESTLGASTGVLLACLGAGWIAAARVNGLGPMMLVTGASGVFALAAGLIRWPDRIVAPIGIVLAGLAGPMAGLLFFDVPVLAAVVVGVAIGAVLVSFRRLVVLSGMPRTFPAALALGLAPVYALGTLVYFIEKLLIV
ncbi:permease [Paenarthrobacter sp. DKR-5]|uniref:permease n=1 Tax=Paenarthrobacter sp. DKR-5 TaxID=2835535 RepID=UPI001BDBD85B|nr:permease [Paenarthrobacter sp. DKR-5]MBT1001125.1 permease [Paenarthrobacter sp. DKR-5]